MIARVSNQILASCPVCHYTLATPFFDGGEQPLATLGWPLSEIQAQSMPLRPLNYVQCPRCTHVWNRLFRYEDIPYTNNPNRMFNKGSIWRGHLNTTRQLLTSYLPQNPIVVDIGCGEGHFVRGLAETLNSHGRFLGFDPNASIESGVGVEFHSRYFDPLVDVPLFSPDLLIMRHVLEHLLDPAAFIDQLAWGAEKLGKPIKLFAEMPCIDKVLNSKRIVDFFYEHPSQFTSQSFRVLMKQGGKIIHLNHGYGGEVVYALVSLKIPKTYSKNSLSADSFLGQANISRKIIRHQLKELVDAGKKIAIWGGTGKAAAFIHYFDVNKKDFPLIVDSDLDKVGTYVPKTGQKIQYRDILKYTKVDVLIIPPQWRAKDIISEMEIEEITVGKVLIEHNGQLIDFFGSDHPYNQENS